MANPHTSQYACSESETNDTFKLVYYLTKYNQAKLRKDFFARALFRGKGGLPPESSITGSTFSASAKIAYTPRASPQYVCIEVALRGIAHGIGRPTGPRGDTHRDRGSNVPTQRYQRYHVTLAGTYSGIYALSESTLL